jgi:hypothetical protein
MNADSNSKETAILRELYPELSPDQLLATKERLDAYFDVVLSILSTNSEPPIDPSKTSS